MAVSRSSAQSVARVVVEPHEPHRAGPVIEDDRPVDEEERGIRRLRRIRWNLVEVCAEFVAEPSEPAERSRDALVGDRHVAEPIGQHVEDGCLIRHAAWNRTGRRAACDRAASRVGGYERTRGVCRCEDADARRGIRSPVEPHGVGRIREPGAEDELGVAPRGEQTGADATRHPLSLGRATGPMPEDSGSRSAHARGPAPTRRPSRSDDQRSALLPLNSNSIWPTALPLPCR